MLRESSVSVTATPLAAMGERVLRGGVCIAGGLLAFEGELGVLGKSKPVLPQGLPTPYKQEQNSVSHCRINSLRHWASEWAPLYPEAA